MLLPSPLLPEMSYMPKSILTLEEGQTVVSQMSDDSRLTLAAIFTEPVRDDIPFEQVLALLKEIDAQIDADEERGYWLIAVSIGSGNPQVMVVPRHRGFASRELVEKLKSTFEFLGMMPKY